jgi:hypothetical protein
MGSGKGSPEYWVSVVKPGRIMFEIGGIPEETAREALRLAATKLPCKTSSSYAVPRPRQVVNKMKANEIAECPLQSLTRGSSSLKRYLFMLRMQHATNSS